MLLILLIEDDLKRRSKHIRTKQRDWRYKQMVSIKDMSLSKKLIGGFGLVSILLIIVAVVSITTLGTIESENNKVIVNTITMKEKGLAMDVDMLSASVMRKTFFHVLI
jgi:hypothetical protein